ncbi:MAG: cytochrome P450 [Myxococcota bacterium]|nr:cytochrome P450 [Myxococcales bacterium]
MDPRTDWHVPAHVPEDLVLDFDLFEIPPDLRDPAEKWHALVRSGAPRIFWSPRNGGHWTFLSYEDIREAYRNPQVFSNRNTPIPPVDDWPVFQPQSVDPPDHAKFRSLLAPLFTPTAVRAMEEDVRRRTRELIDGFADRGQCDFVRDFSSLLPTRLFIDLMGMDGSRLEEFVALSDEFMRVEDPAQKSRNVADIYAVLEDALSQREGRPPSDDIIGVLLAAREPDGTSFPRDEVLNCMLLLFVAGLDTVTSTMTYVWRYLARTPAARRQIRERLDDGPMLNRAVDELFRINAVSNIYRRVAKDVAYRGIEMKRDEKVVLPNTVANRDPSVFENPDAIDLDRKVNAYVTFGLGPHRCIGSHLAKAELTIALQEWLPRIPEFEIDESQPIQIFAGPVMGFRQLPLVWG